MAKITRITQQIFGALGLVPSGGFGAPAAGNVTTETANTSSLTTLMGLAAWANGWLSATIGGSKFPTVEDLNAVEYANTTQLAYLFQQGIPEYDAGTAYYTNSLCMSPGTTQLYCSLTNANTGNALSNATFWKQLLDFSNPTGFTSGDIKYSASANAQTGWLESYGQAVSRSTYAALFTAIGTTYGNGDGSTTFNLPDLRGRVVAGVDNMGGTAANRITNGVSGITGTTLGAAGGDQNYQDHTHTITDPGHFHTIPLSVGANTAPAGSGFQISTGDTSVATTGITINSSGTGAAANVQPTIMMIGFIKT
jgi:microcystin-dependent protein